MSREPRSANRLRITGAAVIISVLGLGYGASWIPELLQPPTTEWIATLPISAGADGMAPGSVVQVGGLAMGEVLSVIDRAAPAGGDPHIEIRFRLDRTVPLSRDARIRKSVGIAGTNGVLDILDPGSPAQAFEPGQPRSIAIDLDPAEGGSFGVLIGRTNGELLERIAEDAAAGQARLIRDSRLTMKSGVAMQGDFGTLVAQFVPDIEHFKTRVGSIESRLVEAFERWSTLEHRLRTLRAEAEQEQRAARDEMSKLRRRFDRIDVNLGRMKDDAEAMSTRWDSMQMELALAKQDLEAARLDASAAATRVGILMPEIGDGLARSMARMVLAGGQLKRATEDLLPLAIEAVTVRPNRASESRRRLQEATDDTVLAGLALRDAARRLATLEELRDAELRRASIDVPSLDRAIERFERTVDALAERLRREISNDL